MLILSVTSLSTYLIPSVCFDQLNNVSNFHLRYPTVPYFIVYSSIELAILESLLASQGAVHSFCTNATGMVGAALMTPVCQRIHKRKRDGLASSMPPLLSFQTHLCKKMNHTPLRMVI